MACEADSDHEPESLIRLARDSDSSGSAAGMLALALLAPSKP